MIDDIKLYEEFGITRNVAAQSMINCWQRFFNHEYWHIVLTALESRKTKVVDVHFTMGLMIARSILSI